MTSVQTGSGLEGGASSGDVTISLKTTCAPGEILKWNGVGWGCDTDLSGSGGTVLSVGSGAGLLGGPITASGSLSLDTGFTDTRYLARTGGSLTGALSLPANALLAGTNQLVLSGGRVGSGRRRPRGSSTYRTTR